MSKPPSRIQIGKGLGSVMSDVRLRSLEWKQMEGTDIGRDYTEGEKGALVFRLAQ